MTKPQTCLLRHVEIRWKYLSLLSDPKHQNLEPASILTHEKRKKSSRDLPMLTYSQVQPRCHELPWLYQRPRNQVPMATREGHESIPHALWWCFAHETGHLGFILRYTGWFHLSPRIERLERHLSQAMLYVFSAARSEAAKPTVMLVESIWVLCFCQGTFQITCYLLESGSDMGSASAEKTDGQVTFWKGGVTSQEMNRPLWITSFWKYVTSPVSKGTSWLHPRLFFGGGGVLDFPRCIHKFYRC